MSESLAALLDFNPGAVLLIFARLVLAWLLGLAIAAIYRRARPMNDEAESFTVTLVLLTILIAMVTQVIGDNVARAFSLVGALSIVRFRTVVRDTQDTAYVIFAVAIGMAMGANHPLVALCGLGVIGVAAIMLKKRGLVIVPANGEFPFVLHGTAGDRPGCRGDPRSDARAIRVRAASGLGGDSTAGPVDRGDLQDGAPLGGFRERAGQRAEQARRRADRRPAARGAADRIIDRRREVVEMQLSITNRAIASGMALVALVPLGLTAQRGGFGGPMQQERKVLAQFDKNGDKRLDAAERKAAREWLATQPRWRFRRAARRALRGRPG